MKLSLYVIRFLLFVAAFMLATLALPSHAEAGPPSREADASAIPASRSILIDDRAAQLEAYLAFHNSPLAPYAKVFVKNADLYGLDWRLVASISGVESTFGKRLPANSYNAYGWNGGNFYFKNWEDGIETVSRTLREKYADKWGADTVWEIAPYYAPPSKTWAGNVDFFMRKIVEGPASPSLGGPKSRSAVLALKLTI